MSAAWRHLFGDVTGYYYDSRTNRYVEAKTGRFVPRRKIVDLLQSRIEYHQQNMVGMTQAMLDGRLSLGDWQRLFKSELKILHIQEAALAKGGWGRMTQADWGRVGAAVKSQYGFLSGFARDIANGTFESGRLMSDGMTLARAGMYAQSGRATYWTIQTIAQQEAGVRQERRIASGDDRTCGPCSELAAQGWVPVGTLPVPGGPPCYGLTHCRCEMEYR